jgi:hypothetical protein
MDEYKVSSIEELRSAIDRFTYGDWVFRGQSSAAWLLEPSINRFTSRLSIIRAGHRHLLGREKLEWRESMRSLELRMFKEYAQSSNPSKRLSEAEDLLDVLVELQHYGAPTRLLDFTLKPYIALFFALDGGDGDLALYCLSLDGVDVIEKCSKTLVDTLWGEDGADAPRVHFYRPRYQNERIEMQSGAFVIPSTCVLPFESVLGTTKTRIIRYLIPGRLRRDIHVMLSQMGVSPRSVYPEREGIIRSFAWEAAAKVFA